MIGAAVQERIAADNRHFRAVIGGDTPDGDVDLITDYTTFAEPHCEACFTGILKPEVRAAVRCSSTLLTACCAKQIVFFGESVPPARVQTCYNLVTAADAVLVVGTSLQVRVR
jgi:NAD-dependent SIR2 family protein deacetylase